MARGFGNFAHSTTTFGHPSAPASSSTPPLHFLHCHLIDMSRVLGRILPAWPHPSRWKRQRCTLTLPPELMYMILEYLPPESVVSFALTCKMLYFGYMPRERSNDGDLLTGAARQALVEWLEKDSPSTYLCFDCLKLHPRRRLSSINPYPSRLHSSRHTNHLHHEYNYFLGSTGYTALGTVGPRLSYRDVRLVMNHHLYGPAHGPTLRSLEFDEKLRFCFLPEYSVKDTNSQRAKIIDNELYISSTTTLWQSHRDEKVLKSFIDKIGHCFLICRHIEFLNWAVYETRRIPELGTGRFTPGQFFRSVSADSVVTRSCVTCFTDYQVEVILDEQRGWVINIKRWYQLGKCRSPLDTQWYNLVNLEGDRLPCRYTTCKAGMIQHRWMAQDLEGEEGKSDSKVEGSFVGWYSDQDR